VAREVGAVKAPAPAKAGANGVEATYVGAATFPQGLPQAPAPVKMGLNGDEATYVGAATFPHGLPQEPVAAGNDGTGGVWGK
jgi:hypothetical protein